MNQTDAHELDAALGATSQQVSRPELNEKIAEVIMEMIIEVQHDEKIIEAQVMKLENVRRQKRLEKDD